MTAAGPGSMIDDARSVWELIERRAAATPDRVMLIDGDRSTSFGQYLTLCERAAAGLHGLGVGAGTNVSWQLPTWTESAVLVGALCRLGAVQNPMLPIYRYREVSFIAKQTKCELLITPSTWNKFDYGALAEQVAGENDDAEKTHVVADDIALVAFPFTHIGGIIIGVYTPLLTGSAAVLMEAWTAPASTELIGRHKVTLANGAAAIHT